MSHVVTNDKAKTQDVKPPLGDDPDGRSHKGRDVLRVTATTTKTRHVESRQEKKRTSRSVESTKTTTTTTR